MNRTKPKQSNNIKANTTNSNKNVTDSIQQRTQQVNKQQQLLQDKINALKQQLGQSKQNNNNVAQQSNDINSSNNKTQRKIEIIYDRNADGFSSVNYGLLNQQITNNTDFEQARQEYLNQVKQDENNALKQLNTGVYDFSSNNNTSSLLTSLLLNDNIDTDTIFNTIDTLPSTIDNTQDSTTIQSDIHTTNSNNISACNNSHNDISMVTDLFNIACYQCYKLCSDVNAILYNLHYSNTPLLFCTQHCLNTYKANNRTTKCSTQDCNKLADISDTMCKVCKLKNKFQQQYGDVT